MEIDGILNNRPIMRMIGDVDRIRVRTSSVFLLPRGIESAGFDEKGYTTRYSRKWSQPQYLIHLFRKRWLKLYIPTLQQTQRWHDSKPNLNVFDLVLMTEPAYLRG